MKLPNLGDKLNPKEFIKNKAVEKAKQSKAMQLAQQAKMWLLRLKKIAIWIMRLIVNIATTLINPLFWLLLGALVLGVGVMSGLQVWGPQQFTDTFYTEEAPNLEQLGEDKRQDSISIYFANSGLARETGAYLGKLAQENKEGLFYSNIKIPNDCQEQCILDKINSGEWKDIELGLFKAKGQMARDILQKAISSKLPWTNSQVQLSVVKDHLLHKASDEKSKLAKDGSTKDIIKEINEFFGISNTNNEIDKIASEVSKSGNKIKDSVKRKGAMGTGKGKGRTDGGKALDSGGLGSANGSIDTSNMIAFLESFALPQQVNTGGGDGWAQGTPEMKAAKELAMQKDGKDGAPTLIASCDRLTATALKAMGIGHGIPWGAVRHQYDWMESHPELWQKVDPSQRQSGDVINWYYTPSCMPGAGLTGWHHTAIYGVNAEGKQMVYQASYFQYIPKKTPTSDANYDPNYTGCKVQYWRYVGPPPAQ